MRCNRRQLNGIKDWEMLHHLKMIITRQEERKRALFNVSIIIYSFIFWSLLSSVSPDMEWSRLVQYEGGRGGGEETHLNNYFNITGTCHLWRLLTMLRADSRGLEHLKMNCCRPPLEDTHTSPLMPFMVT